MNETVYSILLILALIPFIIMAVAGIDPYRED